MQEPEQDYAGDPIQPVISVFIVALALTSHHGLGLGLGLGLAMLNGLMRRQGSLYSRKTHGRCIETP